MPSPWAIKNFFGKIPEWALTEVASAPARLSRFGERGRQLVGLLAARALEAGAVRAGPNRIWMRR